MKILKILILTLLTTISIGQSFGKETPEYLNRVKAHLQNLGFNVGFSDSEIIMAEKDNSSRFFWASFPTEQVAVFTFTIPLTDYAKKNPKKLLEFLNTINGTNQLLRQSYVYNSEFNAIVMPFTDIYGYNPNVFNTYLYLLEVRVNNIIETVKNNKKFKKLIGNQSLIKYIK